MWGKQTAGTLASDRLYFIYRPLPRLTRWGRNVLSVRNGLFRSISRYEACCASSACSCRIGFGGGKLPASSAMVIRNILIVPPRVLAILFSGKIPCVAGFLLVLSTLLVDEYCARSLSERFPFCDLSLFVRVW